MPWIWKVVLFSLQAESIQGYADIQKRVSEKITAPSIALPSLELCLAFLKKGFHASNLPNIMSIGDLSDISLISAPAAKAFSPTPVMTMQRIV